MRSPGVKTVRLLLPTWLIFNDLTAIIGAKQINKHITVKNKEQAALTPADIRKLVKEVRRLKRKYPGWTLIDVESADGSKVKVKL